MRILVRKASPQGHESVGAAERTVRRFKEGAATIRVDLREEGVDICNTHDSWFQLFKYVAFAHNCFACPGEGARTAREALANRQLPTAKFALYGSVVLAEVPESVQAPSRFVKACYLSPQWSSMGHTVITTLEGIKKVFTAKSLKFLTPISFDVSLAQGFLTKTGLALNPKLDKGPQKAYEGPIQPGEIVVKGQPPASFLKEHGRTPGCNACSYPTFHGRVHNKACKERYRLFLQKQQDLLKEGKEQPAKQAEPSPAIVPSVPEPESQDHQPDWLSKFDIEVAEEPGKTAVPSPEMFDPAPRRFKIRTKTSPEEVHAKGQKRPAQEELKEDFDNSDYVPSDVESPALPLPIPIPEAVDSSVSGPGTSNEEPQSVPMEVDSLVDAATMINGSFGLTGPELVSPDVFHLSGVVFDDSAKAKSQTVEFCGSKLKVWQPSSAVSDVSMAELNGDATFKGMLKELGGLSSCKAGNVMNKAQAEAYCHKHGIQVLASRWVTNEKTDTDGAEIVRSRLVVKDFRGSKSARSLEISSPTPSVEALRTVLAYAGRHDWELASLDVSQAFMHTPLKHRKACIKMPLSVSFPNGEPVYMALSQALNGLRLSSRTWLEYITSDTLGPLGLHACEREPCLFSGLVDGVECLVLLYVDDVLIACPSQKVINKIFAALQSRVPTKLTGRILSSKGGGGHLRFLGRNIERRPGEAALTLVVDANYLDSCYDDYKLSGRGGGSSAFLTSEQPCVVGSLGVFWENLRGSRKRVKTCISRFPLFLWAKVLLRLRTRKPYVLSSGFYAKMVMCECTFLLLSNDSYQEVSVFSDAPYAPMRASAVESRHRLKCFKHACFDLPCGWVLERGV